MTSSALEKLERWELYGAIWRLRSLDTDQAEVELCTCHGETVDEVRSSDPKLLRYLARRPSSEDPPL